MPSSTNELGSIALEPRLAAATPRETGSIHGKARDTSRSPRNARNEAEDEAEDSAASVSAGRRAAHLAGVQPIEVGTSRLAPLLQFHAASVEETARSLRLAKIRLSAIGRALRLAAHDGASPVHGVAGPVALASWHLLTKIVRLDPAALDRALGSELRDAVAVRLALLRSGAVRVRRGHAALSSLEFTLRAAFAGDARLLGA